MVPKTGAEKQAILKLERSGTPMKTLDLHGMRHEEARKAVIRFVEDHWGCEDEGRIITGNSRLMMEIVLSVLREYRLDCDLGGTLGLNGFITTFFE